jgi:hypothetical protein
MNWRTLSGLALAGLLVSLPGLCDTRQSWAIDGGRLQLQLYGGVLSDLGIKHSGAVSSGEMLEFDLPIGSQGHLEFETTNGGFNKFSPGSLPLAASPHLGWPGGVLPRSGLRLLPGKDLTPSLDLYDGQGRQWLHLQSGHFEILKEHLRVEVMDVRLGPALASALGKPQLTGVFVGSARFVSHINRQSAAVQTKGGTPNWPTVPGNSIDIAMLRMQSVSQIIRLNGRVAIAPSAYFENIGNGDAPWFTMFATPGRDPGHCFEIAGPPCDPYGNDQGGILVFAFYRILEGRIEQIGLSAAKHAFNSVNFLNEIGSVNCRFPGQAGRIVWSGCEDVYGVGTNADRNYLGPRSEITAHTGLWARTGSVFDADGDGQCDHPNSPYYGGLLCEVPPLDALDRRLHVAESNLAVAGARYFMESWYVVRDDINIFNSMGHKEVTPTFSSVWTFPTTQGASFQQGSVLTQWVDDATTVPGESSALLNTFEGRVRTAMRADAAGSGRFRYRIAVMNHDFDRQIDSISLALPLGAHISATGHFDGDPDGDTSNFWVSDVSANELRWDAPPGQAMDWGVLHSFEFTSALPPINGTVTLGVAESGLPASFNVSAVGLLDDVIHFSGFEDK